MEKQIGYLLITTKARIIKFFGLRHFNQFKIYIRWNIKNKLTG